jgi:hypothetical protein
VESLDAAELRPIDRAWVAARKRRDEVRSASVESIPAEDAFKRHAIR